MSGWEKVVFADDCFSCEMCGEPVCAVCLVHYAECTCPGPTQDDEYEYNTEGNVVYARKLNQGE